MILFYGDTKAVNRYFQFLNITNLFQNEVYTIDKDKLLNLQNNNDKNILMQKVIKVFICAGDSLYTDLEKNIINFGIDKSKICELNELKIRFAYIMFDLNYFPKNNQILSFLLCNFDHLLNLYSSFLKNLYNQNYQYDVGFSFILENNHAHSLLLSQKMEKKYKTINFFYNNIDYQLKNSIELNNSQNQLHAITQMIGINNYKVIISPNAQPHANNTITVNMLHQMHPKPTNKYDLFSDFSNSNYLILPTKAFFDKAKNILLYYQHLLKRDVCLIPSGYFKLDQLKKDLKKTPKQKKAICYAPTILMHDKEFVDSLSLQNGEYIIRTLLNNFKDYDIIFRPHPKTRDYNAGVEYLDIILKKFSKHTNFIYDDSKYYIETFSRTKLLISDFSSTPITYAYSTLNPVLSLSSDGFNKHYQKVFNEKQDIREKFGLVLNHTKELVKNVKYLLDNRKQYKNKIKKHRKEQVFNYGKSVDYFVNNFDYILNNKKHPDWFYIKAKK